MYKALINWLSKNLSNYSFFHNLIHSKKSSQICWELDLSIGHTEGTQ